LKSQGFIQDRLARLWAGCLWLTDRWMPPKQRGDAEQTRRFRTAAGCAFLTAPFALIFAVAAHNTFPGRFGELMVALYVGSIAAVMLGLVLYRMSGNFEPPAQLVIIYFFVLYCVSAHQLGGPTASGLFWLMVPPTAALFALGRRSAVFWSCTSVVAYALFTLAYQSGYQFPLEGTAAQRARHWCNSASALTVAFLIAVLTFERGRRLAVRLLEVANLELEQARDRADAANRSKTAFLANMSHEVRTPMTAVLGFTELAADRLPAGPSRPEELRALETIRRNGHHLLRIVNEMLDLSKIESGRFEIQPSRFGLVEHVSEVVALLRVQAEAKGSALVVEYVDAVPETLETDAVRLQQVLINLVSNAIKFSFEGQVLVRVQGIPHPGMDRVRFQVVDSGIGMTRSQLARVFEPFTQGDGSAARTYGGTGLGLSISRILIELMGGTIEVESTPGVGSTFTVEIPVGTREPVRMLPSEEASGEMRRPRAKPALALHCRVLIVDDNADNRRLIAYFLRDARAEVHAVESGAQALDAWKALAPDVVLMDIQMPHMDGYATTRELRERGCQVPIVALTAHALATERERCLVSGFDGYASKPIDRRRLLELVDQHVRTGRTQRTPNAPATAATPAPTPRPLPFWDRIACLLLPAERREEPAAIARARTILWITLAPLPMLPFQSALVWCILGPDVRGWAAGLVMLAIPIALAVLGIFRVTGSTAAAANTMLGYAFAVIASVTYWSGGPPSPTPFWLVLVPMVAVTLVGTRSAIIWTGLVIAHHVAFLIAFRTGHVFGTPVSPEWAGINSFVSTSGLLGTVILLTLAYERARSEALATLAALSRSLEDARTQADRANRAKTSFLASVSHELRTPMTAILGFADMLLDDWESRTEIEEARSLIVPVRSSGQQLLALINDLLDVSNVESGKLAVERIAFGPAGVLREVVESVRASADAKGLVLTLEMPALPEVVHGDPVRLGQILRKLLDNAIKFTPAGRVDVRARMKRAGEDAQILLAVSDTGPGIPREAFPWLFSFFHQVDPSVAREHGGTGLGLALCQRLVVALGGSIEVDSEVGRGTSFRVVLPAPTAMVQGRAAVPAPASTAELAALILLAEDPPDSQRRIAELLRQAGADVDVAESGVVATEKVRAAVAVGRPYDVLILDMQRPALDGPATVQALRAEGHDLPILGFSTEWSAEERARCLAAGCDECARKPVDRAQLIAALQKLLRDKSV